MHKHKQTADPRTDFFRRISVALLSVYWAGLFVLTHLPRLRPPLALRLSDKTMHFAGFAVLAALLAWSWSLRARFGWQGCLAILAILAVYGVVDEVTQPLVGRRADVADWYADMLGALFGLAAFAAAQRLLRAGR
jgi:VanZ family protein